MGEPPLTTTLLFYLAPRTFSKQLFPMKLLHPPTLQQFSTHKKVWALFRVNIVLFESAAYLLVYDLHFFFSWITCSSYARWACDYPLKPQVMSWIMQNNASTCSAVHAYLCKIQLHWSKFHFILQCPYSRCRFCHYQSLLPHIVLPKMVIAQMHVLWQVTRARLFLFQYSNLVSRGCGYHTNEYSPLHVEISKKHLYLLCYMVIR